MAVSMIKVESEGLIFFAVQPPLLAEPVLGNIILVSSTPSKVQNFNLGVLDRYLECTHVPSDMLIQSVAN